MGTYLGEQGFSRDAPVSHCGDGLLRGASVCLQLHQPCLELTPLRAQHSMLRLQHEGNADQHTSRRDGWIPLSCPWLCSAIAPVTVDDCSEVLDGIDTRPGPAHLRRRQTSHLEVGQALL